MAEGHEPQSGEEAHAALAAFVQAILLAATLMLGHMCSRKGLSFVSEAGIALLLGAALGAMVLSPLIDAHGTFATFNGFSKEFFFLAVLPPIIFEAGWSMNVERLFANCGAIACLAFCGTLISTFVIGLLVWASGALGLCAALSFLEALLFGSIISATDPVTVLAVFQRLGADADLFALVLGESLLNDAVAIVLFRSLATFLHAPVTAGAVFYSILLFVGVFVGSMLVGAAVAFCAAALVKTHAFRSEHQPLESSLVSLFAFASYWLADGLKLSGIVSVLFCGVVAAHFVRPNMSTRGQDRVGAFFKLLSALAETSVFLFIGSSLFMEQQDLGSRRLLPFLLVCFVALALSRAANVWPCVAVANYLRVPSQRIPQSQQFMLWWAGLRGAMAFAIALQAAEELPGGRGEMMLSATYAIILATVLVNGGASAHLLQKLDLLEPEHAAGALTASGLPKYQQLELLHSDPPFPTIPVESSPTFPSPDHTLAGISLVPLQDHVTAANSTKGGNLFKQGVERLRQANQSGGLLSKLERLDKRFLAPLFLAPGSEAGRHTSHPAGDTDDPPAPTAEPERDTHSGP